MKKAILEVLEEGELIFGTRTNGSYFVPSASAGPSGVKKTATPNKPEAADATKKAPVSNTKQAYKSLVVQSTFLICDEETDSLVFSIPPGIKPTGGEVTITYTFD